MDLQVRANGSKITAEMQEFIDRRIARLDRIAEHVVDAHLELRTEEIRSLGEMTTAQITLQTGRHVLRAEVRDPEPLRAIDSVIDKLNSQLRRFNGKRKQRRRRGVSDVDASYAVADDDAAFVDGDDAQDAQDDASTVVRTKRFSVKPMIVDEAIDQMELVGHDFFLFHNADEDQLNVLYKRRDGSLGLLAPSRA